MSFYLTITHSYFFHSVSGFCCCCWGGRVGQFLLLLNHKCLFTSQRNQIYLNIGLTAIIKKGSMHTLLKSLAKLGAYFELITNAIFPQIFVRQLNRSYRFNRPKVSRRFHRQFRDATGQTVLTVFMHFLTCLLYLHCQSTEIC